MSQELNTKCAFRIRFKHRPPRHPIGSLTYYSGGRELPSACSFLRVCVPWYVLSLQQSVVLLPEILEANKNVFWTEKIFTLSLSCRKVGVYTNGLSQKFCLCVCWRTFNINSSIYGDNIMTSEYYISSTIKLYLLDRFQVRHYRIL